MHAWVPSHSPVAIYAKHATFVKSKLADLQVKLDNIETSLADHFVQRGLAGQDNLLATGGSNFFRNFYLTHMSKSTIDTIMRAIPVDVSTLVRVDFGTLIEVRLIEEYIQSYLENPELKNADSYLRNKYGKVVLPGESVEKSLLVHADVCAQSNLATDTLTLDILLLHLTQRLFSGWRTEPVGAFDVYLHLETPFMCWYYRFSIAQQVEPITLLGTVKKCDVQLLFEKSIPEYAKDKPEQLTKRMPVDMTLKGDALWATPSATDHVPEYAIVDLGGALKLANIAYNNVAARRSTQHLLL